MEDYIDDGIETLAPEEITYIYANKTLHKIVSAELNISKAKIDALVEERDAVEDNIIHNNIITRTVGVFCAGFVSCVFIDHLLTHSVALGSSVLCCAVCSGLIASKILKNEKLVEDYQTLQDMIDKEQNAYDNETARLTDELVRKDQDMSYL